MQRKLINSQVSNYQTYLMYLRQMINLACNVFEFKNLPLYVDEAYINQVLLRKGSIAWFMDETLGLIALPYTVIGERDIYNRPIKIQARALNGRFYKVLRPNEYVIMYDNTGYYSLLSDIMQYAERVAFTVRTEDINTTQQRTPRIWTTNKNKEKSLKDALNKIDGFEEKIVTYDGIDLGDLNSVIAPAPYLLDKLDVHLATLWAEFYRLIGVANLSVSKKERMITDEVRASLGGAVASRYSRLTPRLRAVKKINEKFGTNISVDYYDKLTPSENDESEESFNVDTSISNF